MRPELIVVRLAIWGCSEAALEQARGLDQIGNSFRLPTDTVTTRIRWAWSELVPAAAAGSPGLAWESVGQRQSVHGLPGRRASRS